MKVYEVRIDKTATFVYRIKAEDAVHAETAGGILANVEEELSSGVESDWNYFNPVELPGQTEGIDAAEVGRLYAECDGEYWDAEEGDQLFKIATGE